MGIFSRRVARFQRENHAAFLCHPFRQGIRGGSLEVRAIIRHQQHRRLSTRGAMGGRRDVEIRFNLNPGLTLEPNVLALNFRSVRLIQHLHFRGGAIRGNLQPAQFGLQFRDCSLPLLGVKIVQDQLVEFAAPRDIVDVASGRNQQFEIVIEMYRLFMKITLAVFEPADHPLIHGFSTYQGSAVGTRSDEEG